MSPLYQTRVVLAFCIRGRSSLPWDSSPREAIRARLPDGHRATWPPALRPPQLDSSSYRLDLTKSVQVAEADLLILSCLEATAARLQIPKLVGGQGLPEILGTREASQRKQLEEDPSRSFLPQSQGECRPYKVPWPQQVGQPAGDDTGWDLSRPEPLMLEAERGAHRGFEDLWGSLRRVMARGMWAFLLMYRMNLRGLCHLPSTVLRCPPPGSEVCLPRVSLRTTIGTWFSCWLYGAVASADALYTRRARLFSVQIYLLRRPGPCQASRHFVAPRSLFRFHIEKVRAEGVVVALDVGA